MNCHRVLAAVALAVTAAVAVVLAAPAASANPDCPGGAVLNIVAHQDDDLLFQSPDLLHSIAAGQCVRTVYLTAGDAGDGPAYWTGREAGVQAAYAQMAGAADPWTTTDAGIAGHPAPLRALTGRPVSLVFLRLPDGNMDGSGFPATGGASLGRLDDGAIGSIGAVDGSSSYSKTDLSAVLDGLIAAYQPTTIRTLDYVGSYGDGDHSDHHAVAYLAKAASDRYTAPHGFAGYQDYAIADRPVNVVDPDLTGKRSAFLAYAAHDPKTCASEAACASRPESQWWSRQYTVGATPPPTATPTPTPTSTATTATTPPPPPAGGNVAGSATVTASSDNPTDGQTAAKAVDGIVDGYPGDYTKEWATLRGKAGSWLNLAWASPVTISRVVLYDRPNLDDRVTAGKLTFSDGSMVLVGALVNSGGPVVVNFPARTVTSVRFTVTKVSAATQNVGLAEIEAR